MTGSPSGVDPLPSGPAGLICSARGCAAPATVDLQWNNAKIHTVDRRKHWVACHTHAESLAQFLSARGFLRETVSITLE